MTSVSKHACFLIGADSLLIECAKILLEKNFDIRGVVTNTPRIARWAEAEGLKVVEQSDRYIDVLRSDTFEFLFSITNLSILPADVLELPLKMAVNFHDGPLPAYAGLNAPAWALMDHVDQYGISWHEITAGVDEGKILKQAKFDVAADETSLSLNTKCFAAALESFPQLVDELASGQVSPQKQDASQRSYFAKYKLPPAAGFIDWDQPAADIEAFVRSMHFGEYPNPIVSPKLIMAGHVLVAKSGKATDKGATAAPGTIVRISDASIGVATSSGTLELSQLAALDGVEYSPSRAATMFELRERDQLGVLSADNSQLLGAIAKQAIRQDNYWVSRFADLEPAEVPFSASQPARSNEFQETVLPLDSQFAPEHIIAAFGIAIGKCTSKEDFDLALSSAPADESHGATEFGFSRWKPLRFSFDRNRTASSVIANVHNQIDDLRGRSVWMNDLFCRYPNIANQAKQVVQLDSKCLPIAIQIDSQDPIDGASVVLSVDNSAGAVIRYSVDAISPEDAHRLATYTANTARQLKERADGPISRIQVISEQERGQLVEGWNQTHRDYDLTKCLHHQFEDQVLLRPSDTAIVFEGERLTYAELNARGNLLAEQLITRGVGPDSLVGIHVPRSLNLVVATLGVLKAGGAYVPLDPAFPADRIAYMMRDAAMPVVITQADVRGTLPNSGAAIFNMDDLPVSTTAAKNPTVPVSADNLAYVIYTSGSTGNPKGVMVEHRNATNFFVGMDAVIDCDNPGVWLAVTSLSFDISLLELLWTVTRGFKVVVYRESRDDSNLANKTPTADRKMGFGLFMWGNDDAEGSKKYQLLTDGAKYFDENGFDAVWTPERHFGAFGGPYPNPAVTSAAVAAVTKRISIRSGSIVSPLHHPVRIAEDWSVIDNLSDGRVGLSFAAGWQPNDFVLMPQNHANNKQIMLEQIETVRKLWRGESVEFPNAKGDMVSIATLPRPVQKELPVWLTTAGNPESYRLAGSLGTNILTHLLGQTVEEVSKKIAIYRQARADAGYDPAAGTVSLMLHTFVGQSDAEVRALVREPMKEYLRSSMKLVIDFAWSFPAFKRPGGDATSPEDIDIKNLSAEEVDTILEFAFERYYENSGLFGTPQQCLEMINRCRGADIDEIACLLDFGVETEQVLQSLPILKQLRELANANVTSSAARPVEGLSVKPQADYSLPALMAEHKVTHFQCTPSMARILSFDDAANRQLARLKHMMVGGEPLPPALAKDLRGKLTGRLTNMYGPTETTVWSTTEEITDGADVTIGRPIANTQIYILDESLQPTPVGVPGHLYIGGHGVVRGYLNRAELTRDRFRQNPFDGNGSRIYWTGDLARYRPDGTIDFLGRTDHQVKIRGYRIELGEIESALGLLNSIKEAVVVYREPTPGDQRLVAFVVADKQAPALSDVRAELRQNLPEYMLPNDLVTLDALPLTPNGKIDRNRLPEVQSAAPAAASEYVAPESDLEKIIANVWQETLNVKTVGLKDNFFDLGGHSLLIVQVHQRLKSQLESPLSLTDLYRFPTIRSLTDHIGSDTPDAALEVGVSRASRRRERLGLRKRKVR